MEPSDSVSSLVLCKQYLSQQGQGAEASDAPEAWLNVQQGGGKPPSLLVGCAPTIPPIGALVEEGVQGLSAVGRLQAVPEFPKHVRTGEGKRFFLALVKTRDCRCTARGGAWELMSEVPGRLRETDLPRGEGAALHLRQEVRLVNYQATVAFPNIWAR